MTTYLERPRTVAIPEGCLRYLVPSSRNPDEKYIVELDAWNGNGACACPDFECRRGPLLKHGVTPKQALDQTYLDALTAKLHLGKPLKAIKLKVNQPVHDALRCQHCLTARSQFCDDVLEAIRKQHPENYREDRSA